MSEDFTVHGVNYLSADITYNGRRGTYGWANMTPDALRANAAKDRAKAEHATRRADIAERFADHLEREATERNERARIERARKSAATRAHNRDPFGFDRLEVGK